LELELIIQHQAKYIKELEQQNRELVARIIKLEEQLEKLLHQKNSNNSSIPPSKDENRPFKSKSLREKTGKKSGGQIGHKGTTLKMVSKADEILEYHPEFCNYCGKDLSDTSSELVEKRQIVDIPEIKTKVTEHLIFQKKCTCGHLTVSSCEVGLKNRITYGNNIESLTAYFSNRQYIAFKRLEEIFKDVFKANISEGGLHELLKRISKKALPVYKQIKERVEKSKCVGSDETGCKVNGYKQWIWTWQNDNLTFISLSKNRGISTINEIFPKGIKNAVLVHDCWKSHFNTNAQTHQICTAHLLRELNYLTELYNNPWSEEFIKMLKFALDHKKQLKPSDYYNPQPKTILLEKWLKGMIEKPINEKYKELVSFQKRMIKYRNYIFTFLYYPNVPPDNNGSERAIRNIKTKLKVSGQFKSDDSSKIYAVLRSITDTALKNKQNVFNALSVIANSS